MQKILYISLLLIAFANSALADEWPRLEGGEQYFECAKTFEVAKNTFLSRNPKIYLAAMPPSMTNILDTGDNDISGGNALNANQSFFEKIAKNDTEYASRSIYWQKTAQHGQRFVIDEDNMGWRGDVYTLYVVPEKIDKTGFIKAIAGNKKPEIAVELMGDMNWRSPMMLKNAEHHDIWAVNVGHPAWPLNSWDIFTINMDGVEKRCSIHFQPEQGAFKLLPYAVRKFADLLNGTLGMGANEGTLNPTARIRGNVSYLWANIALRPWAVSNPTRFVEDTQKSRLRIDKGLKRWSRQAPSFAKHYQKIIAQYPTAERELEQYYTQSFKMSPEEADALAKQNIDIVYRAHYHFSGN